MAAASAEVLAEPIRLGPVEVANRLVIAPHTVNFGIERGRIDESFVAYMARRARGFGLTIVGITATHPTGRAEPSQPWLWDDTYIPEIAKVADALRAEGTEPAIQFTTPAARPTARSSTGAAGLGVERRLALDLPRSAAGADHPADRRDRGVLRGRRRRAATAGYRLINLHFGHGYLVSQFLSADANQRDDEYGGPLEQRMRLGLEIVRAMRAELGTDVAIDVRINGYDWVEGGIEIDDAVTFGRALVGAGADALNITGGVYGSDPFNLLLPFDGHEFLPLAAAIRGAVDVPVTGVGNIRFAEDAARAVASGLCDLVGVSRAVMADPDWALKVLGQLDAPVKPCIGTLDGCSERLRHFEAASCQVNPEVGRETRMVPQPAASRRVVVVGGGPAGCEAATYARSRGHEVVLLDAGDRVGGALNLAAATPGGAPFGWLADYYDRELRRLGVDVRLGVTAAAGNVAALSPDHVIVATGAVPEVPDLLGIDSAIVVPDEEVLADRTIAPREAVVIGADRRAIATALALAERGRRVTLVDHRRRGPARDASALMRRAYRRELALAGIAIIPSRVAAITDAGVTLTDDVEIPAELVVISLGQRSDRSALAGLDPALGVTVVGDAKSPRSIMDAIAEARDAVEVLP